MKASERTSIARCMTQRPPKPPDYTTRVQRESEDCQGVCYRIGARVRPGYHRIHADRAIAEWMRTLRCDRDAAGQRTNRHSRYFVRGFGDSLLVSGPAPVSPLFPSRSRDRVLLFPSDAAVFSSRDTKSIRAVRLGQ